MCRLLSYVQADESPISGAVSDVLARFTALSAVHKDGWGVAWHTPDDEVRVDREPLTAAASPRYVDQLHTVSDAAVLHLRQATPGIDVSAANTHPFSRDGIGFAHNGFVGPVDSFASLIDPNLVPEGSTDSELYFLAVLTAMRSGVAPAQALKQVAGRLVELELTFSANAMLLTADALHVVCAYVPGRQAAANPADYYALRYHVDAEKVIVASQGIAFDDWTDLPNGSVLTVARSSLERSILD